MFFTYTASVVLLSLAIYGIMCLLSDVWGFYCHRNVWQQPNVSLLILVKDTEAQIEYLMYELISRLERSDLTCDAVIVDCGSDDLTYEIASRMTAHYPLIDTYRLPGKSKPVSEALPLCRGTVVHVVDLVSRVPLSQFLPTVNHLLWSAHKQSVMGRN